jgi:hypothetical protein
MSDIWSGIGIDINKGEGEWLYRVGTEVHGPMPHRLLVEKFLAGEVDPNTLVAREGTDFHPLRTVRAFEPHMAAARAARLKRARKKAWRVMLVAGLPALLVAAGVVGYLRWEYQKRVVAAEKERQAHLAAIAAAAKVPPPDANLPKMGLVALVSLGTEKDVKITQQHPEGAPGPGKAKRKGRVRRAAGQEAGGEDAESGGGDEELVQTCKLSQNDIFTTLRNSLVKINVCVEDEKKRDTEGLLPPTLELGFVVKPNGKVADFAINDRHYRAGPMNNCMIKAFNTIHFPESTGTNCPVTIPIKIGS